MNRSINMDSNFKKILIMYPRNFKILLFSIITFFTISFSLVANAQVLNLTNTHNDIFCFGDATVVTLTASGGTPPYQYNYNAGSFSSLNNYNLSVGTYTFMVQDAIGNTAISIETLVEPPPLNVTITSQMPFCFGQKSGQAFAVGSGGINYNSFPGATYDYLYDWYDTNYTIPQLVGGDSNLNNIGAGKYIVVIEDFNACRDTATLILTQPSQLDVIITSQMPFCFGQKNGEAFAVGSGGTSYNNFPGATYDYLYDWYDTNYTIPQLVGGDSNLNNIGAGKYIVVIEDFNACRDTATLILTQPSQLDVTITSQMPFCFGQKSGQAFAVGSGGTTYNSFPGATYDYLYDWYDTNYTIPQLVGGDSNLNNIGAGKYIVVIEDFNACRDTATLILTQPTQLDVTATFVSPSCFGGTNGKAIAVGSGGTNYNGFPGATFDYLYDWYDTNYTIPQLVGGDSVLNNIGAGKYIMVIEDFNACRDTIKVTVTQPLLLTANVAITSPIACFGGNAMLTITAGGGTVPYNFGAGNSYTVSVAAGSYAYTITDANGCTATTSIVVTQPTVLTASSVITTPIACNGGTATVTVSGNGGTSPYTSTGVNTVTAGSYSYTITDANGCTATTSIVVTQPTVLTASSVITTPIACSGGTATVTVSGNGGTSPYIATGVYTVTAGSYSYTITDANGCTATTSIVVTQPTVLTASSAITTPIACNGGTATITVSGNGGTSPYTATGVYTVTAGSYSYTITDAKGCTATTSIVVTQPTVLTASSVITTPIACNGGTATVTVSGNGGTSPYTATGVYTVTAGSYSYTITDSKGCTATTSIVVTQPTVLAASSVITTPIVCNGGTATLTVSGNGGTSPYIATGVYTVTAGSYSYTITDANGCTATTSIIVTQPTVLTATSIITTPIACNGGTATVTVSGNGGTSPYTATGVYTVTAGSYSYVITDAKGCTATTSIVVTQPTVLTATSIITTPIACNGGTATVTVSGNGGTIPYTATGVYTVTAGSYSYTITDAKGCTATTSIVVTQPTVLAASSAITTPIACNGGTATVTVSGNGGTIPYTATGVYTVTAGSYSYTITDSKGCTATTSIVVTQPTVLTASSVITTPIACNGGTATVTVSGNGGTSPYIAAGVYTVTAGSYSYTITDLNGCTATTSIVVTQPTVLTTSSAITTPIACNGGTATVTVSGNGGTIPYTATGVYTVTAGSYSYTITDSKGCTATTSIVVTQPTVLAASSVITTPIVCNGGTATVTVSGNGGTSPYIATGVYTVTAGSYSYTITDANGCTATTSIVVTQPTVLAASSVITTPIACNGGTATVTVSGNGGTSPYIATGVYTVTAGSYSYTITDSKGCTATTSIVVTQPTLLTASAIITQPICFGNLGSVVIVGNGGSPSYTVSGSATTNLSAGNYSYTVTDSKGCTAMTTVTINAAPAQIAVSVNTPNTTINAGTSLVLTAASASAVSYLWAGPNVSTSSANPLSFTAYFINEGIYTVVVTDANGCTGTSTIEINILNGVYVSLKVLLAGPLQSNGLMVDSFRVLNTLPTTDPYILNTINNPYAATYTHVNGGGGETAVPGVFTVSGNNAIVDWVFLELRNKSTPTIVTDTRSALLQRDGDVVDVDGISAVFFSNASPDEYYVSVRHRNHLGVMSGIKYALSLSTTVIDFTTISANLYARFAPYNNPTIVDAKTRLMFGKRALYAGNCNIDLTNNAHRYITYNSSTISDRSKLLAITGGTGTISGYSIFDIDMNGYARFNGLFPDRLVMLANLYNSNQLIIHEQLP
jgi:hypothetical protein